MKNIYGWLTTLLLATLLCVIIAGCGNSGGETQPAPAQTGDTTAFPNAALLTSISPTFEIPARTIILDARRSLDEYNQGHIPGAIFAPPNHFEKNGILLSPDELATKLGEIGITPDSTIIIYDNTTASRGSGGRLFWILEYLGCENVTILNGGWDFWKAQDMPVEMDATVLSSAVFTARINETVHVVTKEAVASKLPPGPDFILIDVRTDEEYLGTVLNSSDPRPGHIPGAISFPYSKCFNESDKTVLNFSDLKQLLESYGITQDKEVVAYSTVGHRSGFFYYLCRLMGYPKMFNYVGSIVDWGNADPVDYPMETGL